MSDNIIGMRDTGFQISFRQDAGYREIACVSKVFIYEEVKASYDDKGVRQTGKLLRLCDSRRVIDHLILGNILSVF